MLSRREDREYREKLGNANREIIYGVRPGISEGQIPTNEVLEALTNSTARRYKVAPTDLYRPSEIAEELIKEVMDSSFLSSIQKSEYCAKLVPLRAAVTVELHVVKTTEKQTSGNASEANSTKTIQMISLMMAVSTGLFTAFSFIRSDLRDQMSEPLRLLGNIGVPLVVSIVAMVSVTLFWEAISGVRKAKNEVEKTKRSVDELGKEPKLPKDKAFQ